MRRLALVTLLVAAQAAWARNPDGTLGLVITPNNGVPVVAVAGQTVRATLRREAALRVIGPVEADLPAEWSLQLDGSFAASCVLPPDLPPGIYAIEARAGNSVDRNGRSLFVMESFPETYTIAHVAAPGAGPERTAAAVLDAAAAREPAFIVITGDLTGSGKSGEFPSFLRVLDRSPVPTFVSPGGNDLREGEYARYFGPASHMFEFGPDGYILFHGDSYRVTDALGNEAGELHRWRRAIRPARWSVGATHRYHGGLAVRTQITLFVDDPLDLLLFGREGSIDLPEGGVLPWGQTEAAGAPPAADGFFRLLRFGPHRVTPEPPEQHSMAADP